MNTTTSTPHLSERVPLCSPLPRLCWCAIIGGTVAAIGIHVLMTAFGVGAGLATFAPMTDANPVASFSIGAAVVWTICALVALAFGGFVAGRFSHSHHSGFVHGILVWSLTLIISLLMLSLGTGMILGGALKVLGEGVGIGAKAASTGMAELAASGLKQTTEQVGSFIKEAVQTVPTNATPKDVTRATREIGFAVTKLFAAENEGNSASNRNAVIKLITDYTQVSEADATKTVEAWMTSAKSLKTELESIKEAAEQKARVAADRAASNVSQAAIWTFFALVTGLLLTAFSAGIGARCAIKHAVIVE